MTKINKKIHAVYLLALLSIEIWAQMPIENLNAYSFNLVLKEDSIQYIVVCNDLTTPKPTIIFCRGSLPVPLVIRSNDDYSFFPWANWDYTKTIEKVNVVVISKPGIPLIAYENDLNSQFCYITDKNHPHSFPQKYLENDNLEKYVEQNILVINHLLKQRWVDKQYLAIVGHSQGANVALQTVRKDQDNIFALGYFSGNIDGRFTEFIRKERNAGKAGIISDEQAQKNIENLYEQWQEICRKQTSEDILINVSRVQKDFSQSFIKAITTISTPVYVAYGTQDVTSTGCDFLPVYFELIGKTNYKIDAYIHLGHNFEEIINDKSDFSKMHWDEVMNRFIKWLE